MSVPSLDSVFSPSLFFLLLFVLLVSLYNFMMSYVLYPLPFYIYTSINTAEISTGNDGT
jgi:hypothetical protein